MKHIKIYILGSFCSLSPSVSGHCSDGLVVCGQKFPPLIFGHRNPQGSHRTGAPSSPVHIGRHGPRGPGKKPQNLSKLNLNLQPSTWTRQTSFRDKYETKVDAFRVEAKHLDLRTLDGLNLDTVGSNRTLNTHQNWTLIGWIRPKPKVNSNWSNELSLFQKIQRILQRRAVLFSEVQILQGFMSIQNLSTEVDKDQSAELLLSHAVYKSINLMFKLDVW